MHNSPQTPEAREKIIHARKGRRAWNKGVPMSEETRKKMSASKRGCTPWNKGNVSATLDTGRIRLGRKMRARAVVESVIGRALKNTEIVHHIDENKLNDVPENLFLFRHTAAHTRWHHYMRRHGLVGILKSNLALYAE